MGGCPRNLTLVEKVGTSAGILLALGCIPVDALICCKDCSDVRVFDVFQSGRAAMPFDRSALTKQLANIFARPIG